jgi:hypothetical protein
VDTVDFPHPLLLYAVPVLVCYQKAALVDTMPGATRLLQKKQKIFLFLLGDGFYAFDTARERD